MIRIVVESDEKNLRLNVRDRFHSKILRTCQDWGYFCSRCERMKLDFVKIEPVNWWNAVAIEWERRRRIVWQIPRISLRLQLCSNAHIITDPKNMNDTMIFMCTGGMVLILNRRPSLETFEILADEHSKDRLFRCFGFLFDSIGRWCTFFLTDQGSKTIERNVFGLVCC